MEVPKISEKEIESKEIENQVLSSIRIQIGTLDDQIEKNGGRECGWMRLDQEDFIKLYVKKGKNPNSRQFFESLLKNFPLFSPEAIKYHIEKFVENEKLNEEKKQLLLHFKKCQQRNAKIELENLHGIENEENKAKENEIQQKCLEKEKKERLKKLANWRKIKEDQIKESEIIKKAEEKYKILEIQ